MVFYHSLITPTPTPTSTPTTTTTAARLDQVPGDGDDDVGSLRIGLSGLLYGNRLVRVRASWLGREIDCLLSQGGLVRVGAGSG